MYSPNGSRLSFRGLFLSVSSSGGANSFGSSDLGGSSFMIDGLKTGGGVWNSKGDLEVDGERLLIGQQTFGSSPLKPQTDERISENRMDLLKRGHRVMLIQTPIDPVGVAHLSGLRLGLTTGTGDSDLPSSSLGNLTEENTR